MSKFKQFVKDNFFVGVTALNTYWFVSSFIQLMGPNATPMLAFITAVFGFITLTGWMSIAYDRSMKKVHAELAVKRAEIEAKYDNLRNLYERK